MYVYVYMCVYINVFVYVYITVAIMLAHAYIYIDMCVCICVCVYINDMCVVSLHPTWPDQASPEEKAEAFEALTKYDTLTDDEQRKRFTHLE